MDKISVKYPWVEGCFSFQPGKKVLISIVAYEHPLGMPARFCMGLVPAIALSKQLEPMSIESVIRMVDPTTIANYCNGWQVKEPQFKNVISGFLNDHHVGFFFDEAEQMCDSAIEILDAVGHELLSSTDATIVDTVQKIRESGRKHGGELGANNALLYMAAHPFSWLDMYHPLIWKKEYSSDDYQFINLMSKSESRFVVVRKFLQERRRDLSTALYPADHYMAVCNTPCYIPLEGEPTFVDLHNQGYDWCHERYREYKGESGNHRRALKDFESLMWFLGLDIG